jgi:outer membrane receptor for ferric coprogen and ferric-rhodotorulic acid
MLRLFSGDFRPRLQHGAGQPHGSDIALFINTSMGKIMSVRHRKTGMPVPGGRHTFAFSLLALAIHALMAPPRVQAAETDVSTAATSGAAQEMVVTGSAETSASDEEQDYTTSTTRAGTKMMLAPRDVPQSVSVLTEQRMQDQNLQSIGDVLTNTTGVSVTWYDSERPTFYSRGFAIDNFSFDDIPTSLSDGTAFGDDGSDTAIYERIEVVRGATGLMSGSGNPAASVNMVRKHADSKTFKGNVSASYGSWDKQRYVLDASAPLGESGAVRGRVVAGYQDQNSYLDRYKKEKKFLYAVVDADLTDSLTASVGYDYQQSHASNITFGGIPTWYTNGVRTDYSRRFNAAADWAYSDVTSRKAFANLTQNFDNGWQIRLNGTHAESNIDFKSLSPNGFPDESTGLGTTGYGYWYKGKRSVDAVDVFASGPFDLFGRQHQLLAGGNYSRQHNRYYTSSDPAVVMGDFNNWNGDVTANWSDWSLSSEDTVRQKSAYTAARFSLADPLALIVGTRYTQYSTHGTSADMEKNNLTPYSGLVYDINENWSVYASYTSVFQPQKYRDTEGKYLSPITGKNYEAGVKSDWLNGRLTASLAVFRIEQDNVAAQDGGNTVAGTSEQAYYAAQGVTSRGIEFELNGNVTDNLKMTFGATRYVARDADNDRFNPGLPQTSLKLFSSYNLPTLPVLTVGGGVNWQNSTYEDVAWYSSYSGNEERVHQKSYPLASLFTRYQMTPQMTVQANVNNLFDRTYYTYLGGYLVYGEPRSYSVSVSYAF